MTKIWFAGLLVAALLFACNTSSIAANTRHVKKDTVVLVNEQALDEVSQLGSAVANSPTLMLQYTACMVDAGTKVLGKPNRGRQPQRIADHDIGRGKPPGA